jgi:hypothetical protein
MIVQLRIHDNEENAKFLTELQNSVHQITMAKTFITAGHEYLKLRKNFRELEDKYIALLGKQQSQEQIIKTLDGVCRRALEITDQRDLLNSDLGV